MSKLMSETSPLIEFETEYPKLYEILVNGNPVYAALRDGVNVAVNGGDSGTCGNTDSDAGRVSVRRVIGSFVKLKRFKKAKTLIFTSSVYRRDKGRNLAAEFLMDKYPDAVVFEWPSCNEGFDFAYFKDALKDKYCPLEWYLIKYKLYMLLHKKEYNRYCDKCREKLGKIFPESTENLPGNHRRAIEYIRTEMPNSYAVTIISQNIFRKIFKKYQNVEVAVDFWGSARENIIPVLPGKPQSVELQHGIITRIHPGYIYPEFVKDLNMDFFKRILLVYGNKTKEMLTEDSIFDPDKVDVIGNPRVIKYKQEFKTTNEERNLILFTSQPYEQDGVGENYYSTVIGYLTSIHNYLNSNKELCAFRLAIKLHPRETNKAVKLYQNCLPSVSVFDNNSELYELINKSILHLTVSSTVLYEAAMFDVPTVVLNYNDSDFSKIFGFVPKIIQMDSMNEQLDTIFDRKWIQEYLAELQMNTKNYM